MRNVWRALVWAPKSKLLQMLKICYVFHSFLRAWLSHQQSLLLQMLKICYVSIVFCAPVLWTTVCVAPRARRRSVPCRVLSDPLAASAARSRPECRHEPDLSELDPPRPPRRTPDMLQERRRAPIPTTKVVSSVGGDAMYMKWLDEIGLGSWEWESPTPERAF